jgi:hypothetical protein
MKLCISQPLKLASPEELSRRLLQATDLGLGKRKKLG